MGDDIKHKQYSTERSRQQSRALTTKTTSARNNNCEGSEITSRGLGSYIASPHDMDLPSTVSSKNEKSTRSIRLQKVKNCTIHDARFC